MKHKILFFSHSDDGGAGKANVNIAKALISLGNDVQFLVAKKTSKEDFITQINLESKPTSYPSFFQRNKNRFKRIILQKKDVELPKTKHYNKEYYYYNEVESVSNYTFEDIIPHIVFKPDIVIGGWISFFINLETLGKIAFHFHAKAFVIMNDMAHLTGGCHYNWNCLGYTNNCDNCPALAENTESNQSLINLQNKKDSIAKYNIQIIAGSNPNILEARNSALYQNQKEIKAINGILDFNLFNNRKKDIAKQVFDIPNPKKVVLSGASFISDPRKGFDKLQESLQHLNNLLIRENREIVYIILGNENHFEYCFSNIQVLKMESVSEKIMFSILYQAADVFASPSVQDTGPAMVVEALACGTPVVGYKLGFVETFVNDNKNGFVIPKFDTALFAEKIFELLFNSDSEMFSKNAVNSVKDAFSEKQFENFF